MIRVQGGCTLVDAMTAANTDSAVGACSKGSGADTIELTGDVTLTTFHNTTEGDNGLPSVTSPITIAGNGYTIARDTSAGTAKFRPFHIGASGDLTLRNSTVSGGRAREGGSLTSRGGAAFNRGTLKLIGSTLDNNVAASPDPPGFNAYARGGAIYNLGSLTITDSSLTLNSARSQTSSTGRRQAVGGAVYSLGGTLTITNSFFNYNTAQAASSGRVNARGGAIAQNDNTMVAENTRFTNNLARAEGDRSASSTLQAQGGAIASFCCTFSLSNSTVSGNAVISDGSAFGGGISVFSADEISGSTFADNYAKTTGSSGYGFAEGGAINGFSPQMVNSTISGNSAISAIGGVPSEGGGLRISGGYLTNVTIVNNTADLGEAIATGYTRFSKSIVTGTCEGFVNFDLSSLGVCGFLPAPTGLDPVLRDNGGPTRTHALDATSNALNTAGDCPSVTDQRGVSRLAACDTGAFEYNPCIPDPDDIWENQDGPTPVHDDDDDTCWGNELTVGTPQSHKHCDEDWVWFTALGGSTYEIKTINLTHAADTVLETRVNCQPAIIDSDDNGGMGQASKIFYSPESTGALDVRVSEALDSYNPGSSPPDTVEGYEVVVNCIQECDCALGEGVDLELVNDAVKTTATYEACSTIRARNFEITATADVLFRVGDRAVLDNGVVVLGDLAVELDPTLVPLVFPVAPTAGR